MTLKFLGELTRRKQKRGGGFIAVGIRSIDKEYIPHVTLARLRNKKNINDLISPFVRKDFGKIPVNKIQVFESFLQQNFPIYKIVDEFDLGSDN